jgi:hypothetical protein
VLLASEVALAMMLVVGAGLLATSVARLFKSGWVSTQGAHQYCVQHG